MVDIASVYRGPTKVVVEEEPGLFERIAIAFALPGRGRRREARPARRDLLRALPRGRGPLRAPRGATWVGMTAAISRDARPTYAFELNGLPGLPAVSLGFLVPNADLLWRRWRERRAEPVSD